LRRNFALSGRRDAEIQCFNDQKTASFETEGPGITYHQITKQPAKKDLEEVRPPIDMSGLSLDQMLKKVANADSVSAKSVEISG
jgi:hypothetical protein